MKTYNYGYLPLVLEETKCFTSLLEELNINCGLLIKNIPDNDNKCYVINDSIKLFIPIDAKTICKDELIEIIKYLDSM